MIRRILTSVVGIPLLVYLILYAGMPTFMAAVMLATLLAMYEYYLLTESHGAGSFPWLGYLMGFVILLSFYFTNRSLSLFLPGAVAVVLVAALFSGREMKTALETTAFTVFGAWYVAGLMGYLIGVRMLDAGGPLGAHLLMMLFVMIWATDIFAYLVGKNFGRHALAQKASPKKTVEGAVAGFIFSVIAAVVYTHFLVPQMKPVSAAILGALIGVTGQIGDLCESLLKRSVNVKDSGVILPGHGGILDRIDSLLFGAPAMYYYCYFFLHR